MFSMFKNLVGSKALTAEDLSPVLDKMKDHLICTCSLWLVHSFLSLLSAAVSESQNFLLSHYSFCVTRSQRL